MAPNLDLARLAATRESLSLTCGFGGFVLGLMIGLVVLERPTAPLFGQSSVGEVAALSGAVLSGVAFLLVTRLVGRKEDSWRRRLHLARRILDTTGLTILHAGISLFAVSGVFWVFGQAFRDLDLDPYAGAVCVSMATGLVCYLSAASAGAMNTAYLSVLIALFLALGAMSSALSASNPDWWQEHFSSLGAASDASGVAFNFTLVLTGVVLTTLADYLTHDVSHWAEATHVDPLRVKALRAGFVLLGIMLALVGLIPVNVNFTAHNSVAYGMVAVFAALMIAIPVLFRDLSPAFNVATLFVLGILLADVILHLVIGYLNVTAFEMIGVATMFVWLVLFIRSINAAVDDLNLAATRTEDPLPV